MISGQEISEETSERVCTHMNEDHAVSVFAMGRSLVHVPVGWKISEAKMREVTLEGSYVRIVLCHDEFCQMEDVRYPFHPPLTSSSQLRARMVEIHHKLCAPRLSWLISKPICPILILMFAGLAYGALILGRDGIVQALESSNMMKALISPTFHLTSWFPLAVRVSFYFVAILHTAEAIYVGYHSLKTLKLGTRSTCQWLFLILLVGYPITSEFMALLNVDRKSKATNKVS